MYLILLTCLWKLTLPWAKNQIAKLPIRSKHNNTDTASPLFIDIVLHVDSSGNGLGAVVVDIVVQLAVSRSELLLFEEQWVVQQSQGVEDIEVILYESSAPRHSLAKSRG